MEALKKVLRTKNKIFVLLGNKNKDKLCQGENTKFGYLLEITNIF